MKTEYDALIAENEQKYGLPKMLLKALVSAESNFDPKAYRYEKHLKDASYGLCQILYRTAVGIGFKGKDVDLFKPEINLEYGAKYLYRVMSIWKKEEGVEKIKFGLGSYNAGIGSILKAQRLCRAKNIPDNLWGSIMQLLPDVTKENAKITIAYVGKIISQWEMCQEQGIAEDTVNGISKKDIVDTQNGGQFAVVRLVDGKNLNLRIYIEGQVLDAVMQLRKEVVK